MKSGQYCQQCGKCCEKWGWDQKGVIDDIVPWIKNHRTDILSHVGIKLSEGHRCLGKDLTAEDLPRVVRIDYWVDTEGRTIRYCPFFVRATDGKVYCRIHETKPKVCTGFTPWNEGIRDYALNCPACRDTAP